MRRKFSSLLLALIPLAIMLAASPSYAATSPTYIIAFIPVNWQGGLDSFDKLAIEHGEFFAAESRMREHAEVAFKLVHARLDGVSLSDPWLTETVVAFGLTREPADRYIGLTNGDLALNGHRDVAGWTDGPNALGMVVEAGTIEVSAHELGHTFGLCDEYSLDFWEVQNQAWGCPNPFPPNCPPVRSVPCLGLPAPDGSNSIMGPAGLPDRYAYNDPSLAHLNSIFAGMFASEEPPPEPTPEPIPIPQAIVIADPALIRLDPDGSVQEIAPGPALHPDWSPDGEWIAFTSPRDGDLDLYIVPATGGAAQQLTNSPARETHPVWLPNEAQMLFVSDGDGVSRLYRLDLDTNAIRPLNELPAPANWPAISPDGRALVFAAAPDGDWELYQVGLDPNSDPILETLLRLTHSPGLDLSPAWSMDSSRLAYASDRTGVLRLHLLNLADSSITPIDETIPNAWSPRWLADGRLLYQASAGYVLGVWVFDPVVGTSIPLDFGLHMAAWPIPQP